jgi:hypothetical protein
MLMMMILLTSVDMRRVDLFVWQLEVAGLFDDLLLFVVAEQW